jgi:cytochrome c551/c552
MKPNGDYDNMEGFMTSTAFSSPIDMELGPDGRIYILEYGKGWFSKNPDAGIARIDFIAGNRPPKIKEVLVSKTSGVLPFKVQAKVDASDPDKDQLNYVWDLGNGIKKTTTQPNVEHTYTKAGEYALSVLLIDRQFASTNSSPITLTAGNAQPKVGIQVKGNQTFYFAGKPVEYKVNISDEGAEINKNTIYVANNYTKGTDLAGASMGHQVFTETQAGQALMLKSDCQACHQVSTKSIGPAYTLVSAKYQNDPNAVSSLSAKIIKGGGGTWGEVAMPAHPTMNDDDAKKIVQWVLSLENKTVNKASLPTQGIIIPSEETENNVFSIYASYTDQGEAGLKPLSASSGFYLRSNTFNAREITERTRIALKDSTNTGFLVYPQKSGWLKLNPMDLSGIKEVEVSNVSKGGAGNYTIELRLNSETGTVVGKSSFMDGENPDQQRNILIPINPVSDKKLHTLFVIIISDPKNMKPGPLLKTIKFMPE